MPPATRESDKPRLEVGFEWPVILRPALYDAAQKLGHDMRGYIKQQPIPMMDAREASEQCRGGCAK